MVPVYTELLIVTDSALQCYMCVWGEEMWAFKRVICFFEELIVQAYKVCVPGSALHTPTRVCHTCLLYSPPSPVQYIF